VKKLKNSVSFVSSPRITRSMRSGKRDNGTTPDDGNVECAGAAVEGAPTDDGSSASTGPASRDKEGFLTDFWFC
jgi:hypothetical protein